MLRRPAPPSKGGPKRAAVILLTSNRGLAGGFNANLIKEARRRIESLESEGYTVDLYGVGKKGIGFFKYLGRKLATERIDIGRPADGGARGRDGRATDRKRSPRENLASVDLVQAKFHERALDATGHAADPAGARPPKDRAGRPATTS